MASSTGSDNSVLIEKSSSKDNKTGIHEEQTSLPNPYLSFPGIHLTVDLPIYGPQLHPDPLVSNKDGSTDDQTTKGEREKVLEDKPKKEAAAAKREKEAQVEENVRIMTKILRQVFCDKPRTSSRKRLCDVFGDGSIPRKRPITKVKPEEGVGDNFAQEQQAQPGEAAAESSSAIRDDVVVPVLKYYHCPDLNLLPPEEDDEDYYS